MKSLQIDRYKLYRHIEERLDQIDKSFLQKVELNEGGIQTTIGRRAELYSLLKKIKEDGFDFPEENE